MKDYHSIIRRAFADVGVAPEVIDAALVRVLNELIDQNIRSEARPDGTTLVEQVVVLLRERLDFSAPLQLWKWRPAAEVAQMVGLPNTRENSTAVGQALNLFGVAVPRKSNGVKLRHVPPLR